MDISPRKRFFLLIIIISIIVIVVESIAMAILYNTAINEERRRLVENAKSQARLIEAIARFDNLYGKDYPFGPKNATLHPIKNTHAR